MFHESINIPILIQIFFNSTPCLWKTQPTCAYKMISPVQTVNSILSKILETLFTILGTITISLYLIFILPVVLLLFYPYRCFIRLLSKFFKPTFQSMLPCTSGVLMLDHLHTHPTCTIVSVAIMEGSITTETVVDSFKNVSYQEISQRIVPWAGYHFWETDPKFNFFNHIVYHHEPKNEKYYVVDDAEICRIQENLMMKPFRMDRSPWEMVIVRNYISETICPGVEKSAVMLRIHHSMADGFSISKWFKSLMSGVVHEPKMVETDRSFSAVGRLGFVCRLLFYGPVEFSMGLVKIWKNGNAWDKGNKKFTKRYHLSEPRSVPIATIQRAKKAIQVSFTSIIFGALAGSVRRMMLQIGDKLPNKLPMFTPMPLPNHPDHKLTNHA